MNNYERSFYTNIYSKKDISTLLMYKENLQAAVNLSNSYEVEEDDKLAENMLELVTREISKR